MVDTITQTQVSEEEQKDNVRFEELKKKNDLNAEEQKEMEGLKERYGAKMQKRIDELMWKAKNAEERYGKASEELEGLKQKIAELESQKKKEPEPIIKKVIEIGDRQYYTDEALIEMVKNNELTDAEAYKLQRQRERAELREEVLTEIDNKRKQESEAEIRKQDQMNVLKQYPQFSDRHPSFNPDDPLYKEVNRIWNNGYAANPKGLSLAIEDARRILRLTDKQIDASDDLGVRSPGISERNKKQEEASLTEEEKESAIRMYTMGENPPPNPKTGRPYTIDEAIRKAQDAKTNRIKSRRIL